MAAIAAPAPADSHVSFVPVVVTARPVDEDHAPLTATEDAATVVFARDVRPGDTILADFVSGPGGMLVSDHFADSYPAAPVAPDPACPCRGHSYALDISGPLVVLTDGFPWDSCDVWEVDAPVLIVRSTLPEAIRDAYAAQHPGEPLPAAVTLRPARYGGGVFWQDERATVTLPDGTERQWRMADLTAARMLLEDHSEQTEPNGADTLTVTFAPLAATLHRGPADAPLPIAD